MTLIALVGNPNSGKTTLFNELTGSHQRVGNWPGVTVERKTGEFRHGAKQLAVVDLPGTTASNPWVTQSTRHSPAISSAVAGWQQANRGLTSSSVCSMLPVLRGAYT